MIQQIQRRGVSPLAAPAPVSPWRSHLRLRATTQDQPALAAALRALAAGQGWDARPRFIAQLVLEELATNAIRHGGATWVELHVADDGMRVRIDITDDGSPFNPEGPGTPDASAATMDREGGLGLLLLHGLASSLHYVRRDGHNHTQAILPLRADCFGDHGN